MEWGTQCLAQWVREGRSIDGQAEHQLLKHLQLAFHLHSQDLTQSS